VGAGGETENDFCRQQLLCGKEDENTNETVPLNGARKEKAAEKVEKGEYVGQHLKLKVSRITRQRGR